MDNCKRIIETRNFTRDALLALGFEVLPSSANFLFAKSSRISGEALYLALKARGVLVRHFSDSRICEYNRITIGAREDMEKLVALVGEILNEKGN